MPTKKKTGTGITQRESVSFDHTTKEGQAEGWDHLRKFLNQEFSFEGLQGRPIERLARSILEKAGLAEPSANLFELAQLPIGDSDPDSAEGYAVRFIGQLRLVRAVIAQGRPDEAARFGGELMGFTVEAAMKFRWERFALSGYKRAKDLKSAAQRHNKSHSANARVKHAHWRKKARRVWETHRRWGALKVAEVIAEPGESADYIRQLIHTEKPQK